MKKGSKPIFHLFYEYKIHVTTVLDNSNHGKYLQQCWHLGVLYSHFAHNANWTNLTETPSAHSRVTLCWAFPESAAQDRASLDAPMYESLIAPPAHSR